MANPHQDPAHPSVTFTPWRRLAVVGCGQMGSSILRAAKLRSLAGTTVALEHSGAVRKRVGELHLADEWGADPSLVAGADCILLCVPVHQVLPVLASLAPHVAPGAVVGDVASVRCGLEGAPALLPQASYVPTHPMAGTERSGPDGGSATLFEGRWCLLTPQPGQNPQDVTRMVAFWRQCGANTKVLAPNVHDQFCALVSHLPHALAYSLCRTLEGQCMSAAELQAMAGPSLASATRVAASDPALWAGILQANRHAVLKALDGFSAQLDTLRALLAAKPETQQGSGGAPSTSPPQASTQALLQAQGQALLGWLEQAQAIKTNTPPTCPGS
ncbi:prephenate dehydrogenase/arogenate dehydrogenase family protein [Formicincola oecophyllae]|uniref:Prephenate dehydrogenase/arogenate dehydrogenase family protein n=1 Tax=Formicincola oecophyllae TaxID=2558361 RepID=A0A4Y6U910_9PROT|nr:prephenate dehydrogenase/arogenate dehydrogenase family protein [Formicincola oecophyllae]QDH13953.1 prephenate dehydrogenase/arogenate dehydrogenase family protein [Formicincola oecophyllae]